MVCRMLPWRSRRYCLFCKVTAETHLFTDLFDMWNHICDTIYEAYLSVRGCNPLWSYSPSQHGLLLLPLSPAFRPMSPTPPLLMMPSLLLLQLSHVVGAPACSTHCFCVSGLFHSAEWSAVHAFLSKGHNFIPFGWVKLHCVYTLGFFIYSSVGGDLLWLHNLE